MSFGQNRAAIVAATIMAAGAASTLSVAAADLTAQSRAEAVTVFPDGALATRTAAVSVPAGDSMLRLPGLPAGLDAASIRAEARADGPLEIGAVDIRQVAPGVPEPHAPTETETRVKALEAERQRVEDTIRAAETERRFIERFTQIGAEGFVKALAEGKSTPESWRGAFNVVGEGMRAVAETIRTAEMRRAEIDDELKRLRRIVSGEQGAARPSVEAVVALAAPSPVQATIVLTYRVAAARWTPVYDARLSTRDKGAKASLELVSRAAISQSSGEDWSDVQLILSTARTKRATRPPGLDPLIVKLAPPPRPLPSPPVAMAPAPGAASEQAARARRPEPRAFSADEAELAEATEREAAIDDAGLSVTFRIAGRVSVPSGDEVKTLRIASRTYDPSLIVRTVPKLAETAFLVASFDAASGLPLLPGKVSLFRDHVFIGTAQLPFTAAGAKVELGFGEDDRVKVSRTAVKRTEGEAGVFTSVKTDEREFKIAVKNLSPDPVTVEVRDQYPVSESQDVVVETLPGTTPPTRRDVEDKRGVMAWILDLKGQEEKEIRVGWRVRHPADKPIVWSGPLR